MQIAKYANIGFDNKARLNKTKFSTWQSYVVNSNITYLQILCKFCSRFRDTFMTIFACHEEYDNIVYHVDRKRIKTNKPKQSNVK